MVVNRDVVVYNYLPPLLSFHAAIDAEVEGIEAHGADLVVGEDLGDELGKSPHFFHGFHEGLAGKRALVFRLFKLEGEVGAAELGRRIEFGNSLPTGIFEQQLTGVEVIGELNPEPHQLVHQATVRDFLVVRYFMRNVREFRDVPQVGIRYFAERFLVMVVQVRGTTLL